MLYPTHSVEQMQVSVTALCDFAARSGDLDLRFTPGPSAVEGMEGHRIIAARRAPGFASEVAVQGEAGSLNVRGRADGFSLALQLVEEVKTHKGPVDRIPLNQQALHWAQAMVYGHLLCREHGLAHMDVRLLYYDLLGHKEHADTRRLQAAELEQFFDGLCARFRQWGEQEQVHRKTLLDALQQMEFPLGKMRPGQRLLAQQVFIGARRGRVLLAQAPTGIGKSLGTLFPMLKAMSEDRIDKLLFLSAKTTGRATALEALQRLRQGNTRPPLRVVEITARDKVCVHPGAACHGESCPLAKGFYDRLPQARLDAVRLADTQLLDQPHIAAVAAEHTICSYYLSQELVRWADVVVGDYNYWFDTSAFVYAMAVAEGWRAGLLVDEAHNQFGNRFDRTLPVVPSGRNRHNVHLQLPGAERRQHIQPGMVLRQAQHVGIEARRLQRGREQHRTRCRLQPWPQKGCRHHIAQGQHAIVQPAARQYVGQLGGAQHIAQGMVAKLLRQPRELDRVKVELLQLPG